MGESLSRQTNRAIDRQGSATNLILLILENAGDIFPQGKRAIRGDVAKEQPKKTGLQWSQELREWLSRLICIKQLRRAT